MNAIPFVLLVTLCTAVSAADQAADPAASERSQGTWRSESNPASGSWSADLVRRGDDLSGEFSLTNSPIESGEVAGMITDGNSITFGVLDHRAVGPTANRNAITFSGTLDGSTITGTYTTAFGDKGSWEGTIAPH